jgi:hypothetical protein
VPFHSLFIALTRFKTQLIGQSGSAGRSALPSPKKQLTILFIQKKAVNFKTVVGVNTNNQKLVNGHKT